VFKRRKQAEQDDSRVDEFGRRIMATFDGLRGMVLATESAGPGGPRVLAGLVDMGMENGAATLVCLRDGTTSRYVSSGGGVLGGHGHDVVVAANTAFLDELTGHVDHLRPDAGTDLPAPGRTVLRALTLDGWLSFEALEDDLGNHRSPLSPAFHAAHEVLGELRAVAQPAEDGR
jgi:hypothetical protein